MGKPEKDCQPKNAMLVGREGQVIIEFPFTSPLTELPVNPKNWTPKIRGGNDGKNHGDGSKRLESD